MRRIYLIVVSAFLISACSTTNRAVISLQYEVLLSPQLQNDYLTTKYLVYQFSDCKRVSRAENRWQFTYTDRQRGQFKMQKVLGADSLIQTIALVDTLVNPPTNSSNQGFQKSKPIKNQ